MDWSDLFTALGLAIVIEGVFYALAPETAKRAFQEFFALPTDTRRIIGLVVCVLGLGIVWIARN